MKITLGANAALVMFLPLTWDELVSAIKNSCKASFFAVVAFLVNQFTTRN